MKIKDVKSTLTTDLGYHELFMYPALSRILRLLKAHDMKELSVEAHNELGLKKYVYKKHWWRNKSKHQYSYLDTTLQRSQEHNITKAINADLDKLIQYVFGSLDFAQRRHILISIKAKKKYTVASLKFLHQAPNTENLVSKTKFVMDEIDLTVEYDNDYNRVGTWDSKTGHITYFSNSADPKSENSLSDSEIEDNGVVVFGNVQEVKNPQLKEISTDQTLAQLGSQISQGWDKLKEIPIEVSKTTLQDEIDIHIGTIVSKVVYKICSYTGMQSAEARKCVTLVQEPNSHLYPSNPTLTIGITGRALILLNEKGITREQIFEDGYSSNPEPLDTDTNSEPVAVVEVAEPQLPVTEAETPETIIDKVTIPSLPDLEDHGMGAGRITVDDKAMINCESDLNQLVPFKYSWAWQGYLKGTEHHWMPQEQELRNDDWENASASETKAITSALFDLKCWSLFKSRDPLLQIYEFVTNPEVRQYILRQRFEHTVWGNFVEHVVVTYGDRKVNHTPSHFELSESQYYAYIKCVQVAAKQKHRNDMLDSFCTGEFTVTPKAEDMANLVRFLINFYINHVFIFNFTSLIQMLGYKHSDNGLYSDCKYPGLVNGFELVFRDVVLQLTIGISIIKTIIEENPELQGWLNIKSDWYATIASAKRIESEYMDWWANTQSYKTTPVMQINTLNYMVDMITNSLGITDNPLDSNNCATWFIALYNKCVPTYSKQESVLGSTSSGAALSWDE